MKRSLNSSSQPSEPLCGDHTLDLRGEVCPYTFVRVRLRLEDLSIGSALTVIVDHEPATRNIPRSARSWGQSVEDAVALTPGQWQIRIIKRVV